MISEKLTKADQPQEQDQKVPDWKESFQKMREGSKLEEPSSPGRRGPFPAPVQQEASKVIQLDFWEENKRGVANSFVRSALFPALGKGQRRFLDGEKIESVAGIDIYFTGKQLDQSDFDVYLEILNIARQFPLGTPVYFSARGLLMKIGKSAGGKDIKWLHSVIVRLCGGVVDATDHKKRYFGQLLYGGSKYEVTQEYEVTINPRFAILFGFGMWTKIDVDQRRKLKGSTSRALHLYYSSHKHLAMHSYDTLIRLCGLKSKNKRATIARLIESHENLKEIGFLATFTATKKGIQVFKK